MNAEEVRKSWNDFNVWIEKHSNQNFFRGVSNKEYLLLPSIGRMSNYSYVNERNMFEHFKLKAQTYVTANNDFEWLTIAQHHGLRTRLLDWTSNPLVAAYFACVDNTNKTSTGRIYSICVTNYVDFVDLTEQKDPFDTDWEIQFLSPPMSSKRIELQRGVFSLHPNPHKPVVITDSERLLEIPDFFARYSSPHKYIKLKNYQHNHYLFNEKYYEYEENQDAIFDIQPECKEYFEKQIRLRGIDEMIFGDLDSIAKYTNYCASKNNLHNIIHLENGDEEELEIFLKDQIPLFLQDRPESLPKNFRDRHFLAYNFSVRIRMVGYYKNEIKIEKTGGSFLYCPNYWDKTNTLSEYNETDIKRYQTIQKIMDILGINKRLSIDWYCDYLFTASLKRKPDGKLTLLELEISHIIIPYEEEIKRVSEDLFYYRQISSLFPSPEKMIETVNGIEDDKKLKELITKLAKAQKITFNFQD